MNYRSSSSGQNTYARTHARKKLSHADFVSTPSIRTISPNEVGRMYGSTENSKSCTEQSQSATKKMATYLCITSNRALPLGNTKLLFFFLSYHSPTQLSLGLGLASKFAFPHSLALPVLRSSHPKSGPRIPNTKYTDPKGTCRNASKGEVAVVMI